MDQPDPQGTKRLGQRTKGAAKAKLHPHPGHHRAVGTASREEDLSRRQTQARRRHLQGEPGQVRHPRQQPQGVARRAGAAQVRHRGREGVGVRGVRPASRRARQVAVRTLHCSEIGGRDAEREASRTSGERQRTRPGAGEAPGGLAGAGGAVLAGAQRVQARHGV